MSRAQQETLDTPKALLKYLRKRKTRDWSDLPKEAAEHLYEWQFRADLLKLMVEKLNLADHADLLVNMLIFDSKMRLMVQEQLLTDKNFVSNDRAMLLALQLNRIAPGNQQHVAVLQQQLLDGLLAGKYDAQVINPILDELLRYAEDSLDHVATLLSHIPAKLWHFEKRSVMYPRGAGDTNYDAASAQIVLNAVNRKTVDLFKQYWLPVHLSATDAAQVQNIQISILKELYPKIWAGGYDLYHATVCGLPEPELVDDSERALWA